MIAPHVGSISHIAPPQPRKLRNDQTLMMRRKAGPQDGGVTFASRQGGIWSHYAVMHVSVRPHVTAFHQQGVGHMAGLLGGGLPLKGHVRNVTGRTNCGGGKDHSVIDGGGAQNAGGSGSVIFVVGSTTAMQKYIVHRGGLSDLHISADHVPLCCISGFVFIAVSGSSSPCQLLYNIRQGILRRHIYERSTAVGLGPYVNVL
mmetsp:Transcript_4374/g.12047  ORF Transcript_4374/g.12047 Transcript_4374/m.12047 type:complete len:202 (+) Transcript_4374:1185-1790(+)